MEVVVGVKVLTLVMALSASDFIVETLVRKPAPRR